MEVFTELFDGAVKESERDIVPAVDVDLLEIGRAEKRCEDTVFRHLAVQLVDKHFRFHAFYFVVMVTQILVNVVF